MTAGDLAVIGPLARRIAPHLRGGKPELMALLEMWPEVLDAVDQLLPVDAPSLRDLPLHEAVAALTELVQEWLAVNGPYMAESVAPAVTQLSQTIVLIVGRAAAGVQAAAAPAQ